MKMLVVVNYVKIRLKLIVFDVDVFNGILQIELAKSHLIDTKGLVWACLKNHVFGVRDLRENIVPANPLRWDKLYFFHCSQVKYEHKFTKFQGNRGSAWTLRS